MKPPRTPLKLSDSITHQLNAYALAAGAAGVGLLALTSAAEARIVYTPAHVTMHAWRNQVYYHFDLNHDKVADITFLLSIE